MLSFSFHSALQFECLAHQSILLWLHFTWFHDICIIWSFCTTIHSHKIDHISKLLERKPTNPVKYSTIIVCQRNVSIDQKSIVTLTSTKWNEHISNCDYVLSWQFLCEMLACLQTHIKNRLFVRQYPSTMHYLLIFFFFSAMYIWIGVSWNSQSDFQFHVYLFVCSHRQIVVCFFSFHISIYFFFSLHRRRQCCCFCNFPAHFDGLMVCPFDG